VLDLTQHRPVFDAPQNPRFAELIGRLIAGCFERRAGVFPRIALG
jgi:hypothetical protein